MIAQHIFDTPEGIRLTVTVTEKGLIDGVQALDFKVKIDVPGYVTDYAEMRPWSKIIDVCTHRDPEEKEWEYADYVHDSSV